MSSCVDSAGTDGADTAAATDYCQCTFDAISTKYTAAEFKQMVESTSTDDSAMVEEIMSIAMTCLAETGVTP